MLRMFWSVAAALLPQGCQPVQVARQRQGGRSSERRSIDAVACSIRRRRKAGIGLERWSSHLSLGHDCSYLVPYLPVTARCMSVFKSFRPDYISSCPEQLLKRERRALERRRAALKFDQVALVWPKFVRRSQLLIAVPLVDISQYPGTPRLSNGVFCCSCRYRRILPYSPCAPYSSVARPTRLFGFW